MVQGHCGGRMQYILKTPVFICYLLIIMLPLVLCSHQVIMNKYCSFLGSGREEKMTGTCRVVWPWFPYWVPGALQAEEEFLTVSRWGKRLKTLCLYWSDSEAVHVTLLSLSKWYLWATPFLHAVSEGAWLETQVGISGDTPGRFALRFGLFAREASSAHHTSGFAQSLRIY